MKKILLFCFLVLIIFSCQQNSKKEKVAEMEYLDYWQGYKITSTEGSIAYRQPGWVQQMDIHVGDDMAFNEGEYQPQKPDTLHAKIVYVQYKDYPSSNEVPASYYSGEYQGIAVPDTTNLKKTIFFVSKHEPVLGQWNKFSYRTMLGGDRTKWQPVDDN